MDLNFNNGAASLQQQLSLTHSLPQSLIAPQYAAGASSLVSASASASIYSQLQSCAPCALSVSGSAMPLENGDLSANMANNGAAGITSFAACTSRAVAQQQQFGGATFGIASQTQQFTGPLLSATSPVLQAQQLSQMAQVCTHTLYVLIQTHVNILMFYEY